MRKRGLPILLAVLACAASFCVPARAQYSYGSIEGMVKGEDGQPVVGAQVLIVNTSKKWKYKTKTDKNGRYYHGALVPGNKHTITLMLNGKKRFTINNVSFQPSQPNHRVDIDLQAAARRRGLSGGRRTVNLASLESAARAKPGEPNVYADLGEGYLTVGKKKSGTEARALFQKSVEAHEKAIALSPDGAGHHSRLATSLVYVGELQRAHEEAGKATALDPTTGGQYFFNLGATLTNKFQTEEAKRAYRKTIELEPNHADAWYQLGVALSLEAKLDEKSGKSAPVPGTVEALKKYIELQPAGPYTSMAQSMIDSFGAKVETEFKKEKKKRRRRGRTDE